MYITDFMDPFFNEWTFIIKWKKSHEDTLFYKNYVKGKIDFPFDINKALAK